MEFNKHDLKAIEEFRSLRSFWRVNKHILKFILRRTNYSVSLELFRTADNTDTDDPLYRINVPEYKPYRF